MQYSTIQSTEYNLNFYLIHFTELITKSDMLTSVTNLYGELTYYISGITKVRHKDIAPCQAVFALSVISKRLVSVCFYDRLAGVVLE